jgi:hypothetical protein
MRSFTEIIEIVDIVLIHSHSCTSKSVTKESREPEDSDIDSIDMLIEKPLENVFLNASIELAKVELLVKRRS